MNDLAYKSISLLILCIVPLTAEAAFEDVELGARPLGMGSAYVAVADGAEAIFWNPSGIVLLDGRELTTSYMELYDLVSYSSVGYAQRMKIGFAGLGLVSSSDVDGVYREVTIALTAAREIQRGFAAGANVKYLSSSANTGYTEVGSGRGLSLDMGCQYHIKDGLASIGVAIQNLIGLVSYSREAVKNIPGEKYFQRPGFSYKAGAVIDLYRVSARMGSTILAAELADGDIHMGAEHVLRDIIAIRAGFRTGNALTRAISMGFGLNLPVFRLDYAYVGSQVGAQTSQFSVSIKW